MKLFFLLSLLILTFVGVFHERGLFEVKKVEVVFENPELKSSPYWSKLIGKMRPEITEFENKKIWQVPLEKIADKFQKEIWVKDISVTRGWPQNIQVKIKNREMKMLLATPEGQLLPVDTEGSLLPPIAWNESPKLPLLRGKALVSQVGLRKKILDFFKQIPKEGSFSESQISDVSYNESEGFIATLIWKSLQVKLGFEPSTLVSLRLSQVLDYLQSRNIDVRVIDSNFSKKVLVKLRNQP